MHVTIAHRRIRFRWFVTVLLDGAAILAISAQAGERAGESLRIRQDQTTLTILAGERPPRPEDGALGASMPA